MSNWECRFCTCCFLWIPLHMYLCNYSIWTLLLLCFLDYQIILPSKLRLKDPLKSCPCLTFKSISRYIFKASYAFSSLLVVLLWISYVLWNIPQRRVAAAKLIRIFVLCLNLQLILNSMNFKEFYLVQGNKQLQYVPFYCSNEK